VCLHQIDEPMTARVFGMDRGLGVRFWGKLFDKQLTYYLDVVNAVYSPSNRTITPDPSELDGSPAILFRTQWHVLGDDPDRDFALPGDLDIRENPALEVGFHYVFNDDAGDRNTLQIPVPLTRNNDRGGFALVPSNGVQINQFGFDSAFKWRGFSAGAEYILRIVDPRRAGRTPYAPWWHITGQDDTVVMHGGWLQLGYFLPIPGMEDKLELVGRFGGVSTAALDREGVWEYSGGLNYYIRGNNLKLQMDVTKIYEAPTTGIQDSIANVNDDVLLFRLQLQFLM
jgi:hypothetical protein